MANKEKGLELSDVISKLREDLQVAMKEGEDQQIKFRLDRIDLELKVAAKQVGEGKAGIKFEVLGVGAEIGGGGKLEKEQVQTLKITMVPTTKEGGTAEISGTSTNPPPPRRDSNP